jgi:DNA (cytosine-5)-methyltransferase 1
MAKPKAIDLFSGCGGLTLGLKQAGFRVVGAIEIDPLAAETYRKNHRGVKVWQNDICELPVDLVMQRLRLEPGQLDLVAGCPPCQGFSTLTTLNGRITRDDPRNDLVFHFLRFVHGLRPKAVMMENVPGLAKDRRIEEIVALLEGLGYQITRDVLDAADYGVPQRRKRFILLGGLGRKVSFGETVAERRTVRWALAQLTESARADRLHTLPETRRPEVWARIRQIPHDGGSRVALGEEHQLECHRDCDGFKDVYGRMAWDAPSPTITGGCCNPSKGAFSPPNGRSHHFTPRGRATSDISSRLFFLAEAWQISRSSNDRQCIAP